MSWEEDATDVHQVPMILDRKDVGLVTATALDLWTTFVTLPLDNVNAELIHMVENVTNVEQDFGSMHRDSLLELFVSFFFILTNIFFIFSVFIYLKF